MKTLIVDSSVIVKWLNQKNEENLKNADKILEDIRIGKIEVLAPELAKYEIGNVLLKGKQLTIQEAYDSFDTFYSLPITFITESEELARLTYAFACEHNITYYDASFLALAKLYNATLITSNIKHQGKSRAITVLPLSDY